MGSTWAQIEISEGSIRIRRDDVVFVRRSGTTVVVEFRHDPDECKTFEFKTEAEAIRLVAVITAA